MYLFTRSGRLAAGNVGASMNWAHEITEKVNQVTELHVELWTPVFSPGIGTLTWTAVVDDLSQLENADTKLGNDAGVQLLLDEGARFQDSGGINDTLDQILWPMEPPTVEAPAPMYAAVVTATMAPGSMAKGVELGFRIADHATKLTGHQTVFMASVTGRYGGIAWLTGYANIDDMQRAQQMIAMDSEFVQIIDDEASKVYQSAAEQTCYRRLL